MRTYRRIETVTDIRASEYARYLEMLEEKTGRSYKDEIEYNELLRSKQEESR